MNTVDVLLASTRVFILSGGAAKRAGGINKSFLQIEGKAILEHQIERLSGLLPLPWSVITDRPEDYANFHLSTFPDFDEADPEERFPLRGFARALSESAVWTFILASDMPWPDPELIRAQAQAILDARGGGETEPAGLVIRADQRIQPFHAFYHASLASSAKSALSGPDRSLRGWIQAEPSVRILELSEVHPRASEAARAFDGFNAPPA